MRKKIALFITFFLCGEVLGEQVAFRKVDSGELYFQIQDARENASYSIELVSAGGKHSISTIDDFGPTTLPKVLEASWDGDLPEGIYYYNLLRDGEAAGSSKHPVSLDGEMDVVFAEVERREGKLRWEIGRPAVYRLVAGMNSGAFLGQVKPWSFTDGSKSEIDWDFNFGQGVKSLAQQPGLTVYAQYFPISRGFIISGEPEVGAAGEYLSEKDQELLPNRKIAFELYVGEKEMSRPSGVRDRLPMVHAGTPIRVKLSEQSRDYLEKARFEVLIYIDGEFIHEESQGVDPYTFVFPEVIWADGKRTLAINVLDNVGNFGAQFREVVFK